MKSLRMTTRIAADGMLHLLALEFANQEVEVIVLPASNDFKSPKTLIGQDALEKAQEIGFVGSLDAEADFSARYKEELDWAHKI
jgi:hypothetical protein